MSFKTNKLSFGNLRPVATLRSFSIRHITVMPAASSSFYGGDRVGASLVGGSNLSFYGTPSMFDNPHKTFYSELQGASMSFYSHQGNNNGPSRSFYG
jgi:hypothetical protein